MVGTTYTWRVSKAPIALYLNRGDWRFEEVTEAAGVGVPDQYSTGTVLVDIEGDGDLDALVTALDAPPNLLLNDGTGTFTIDQEFAAGHSAYGSTSMALADIDGDSDLDLYIGNYKRIALRDSLPPPAYAWDNVIKEDNGQYYVDPAFAEHYSVEVRGTKILRFEKGESDQFLRNEGSGLFRIEELLPGSSRLKDWALTVRFQDLDGNGTPDLYVCNDFESPDYIWMNYGDFQPVDSLAFRKTSNASMALAVSDINKDGHADIFVADMLSRSYARRQIQKPTMVPIADPPGSIANRPQVMQNTAFLGDGSGSYHQEVGNLLGISASDWTWSSSFLDVDLDGYEDLLLTNGHAFDVQNRDALAEEQQKMQRVRNFDQYRRLILDFPSLSLHNAAFRNDGGSGFIEMPLGWGLGSEADVSHGMALGDLDNDGDLDVVINRLNAPAGLYRNTSGSSRVLVRLRGEGGNSRGIGSRIRVSGGGLVQEKELISGGEYLSGSSSEASFAGLEEQVEIEVFWRSGRYSRIEGAPVNRIYEVYESGSAEATLPVTGAEASYFEHQALDHKHFEQVFDDFERQPLLPRRLSQGGPSMALADLDADGDEDLVVGSGSGGHLAMLYNNGSGAFTEQVDGPLAEGGDHAGVLVLPVAGGGVHVWAAHSGYEGGASSSIGIYNASGELVQRLAFGRADIGPLSGADVDGDGDVDVFAGALSEPGRYPEPGRSRLYLNEGGRYEEGGSLPELGLVSASVFGDLDGDADQDLVLAQEWGHVAVLINDGRGGFVDASADWGTDQLSGRWNGVALGDFDSDGRLDVMATNWGWNSRFGRPSEPLRLYWGDVDGNGSVEVIESVYEEEVGGYAPSVGLNLLWYSVPYLRQQITRFSSFAEMDMGEVFGRGMDRLQYREASGLGHLVLLNRGAGFESRALPLWSQVSPAFGVGVGDYDGDGCEDAFLGQNYFAEQVEVPRSDAGRGQWLRGDCTGGFEVVESGIRVYGEQRSVVLGDVNADARVDVVVSQNGAQTQLWQNAAASAGEVVRVEGEGGNRWGIGSTIRLHYSDGSQGPARLVDAGSGYRGQDGAVQVLGKGDKEVVEVEIRR